VNVGCVPAVAVDVEEPFQLRVVREVAVSLEDGQVHAHLVERRRRLICPVRPAHRDLARADVDGHRPLGFVAELENEASRRFDDINTQARRLKVCSEPAELPLFLGCRLSVLDVLQTFERRARIVTDLVLPQQVEVVAHSPGVTQVRDGHTSRPS
jgi:hypothetical protein